MIGGRTYRNSVVVTAETVEDWPPQSFDMLTVSNFEQLAPYDAEIVIIGTGQVLKFPRTELLEPLRKQKCGFEIMDTKAACRTFNVLVGDDRRVAACLLPDTN